VYFQQFSSSSFIYYLLYVVDLLIALKDKSLINKLKSHLNLIDEFEMKDLAVATKILGMKTYKNRKADKLYLSQRKYLKKVLDRFHKGNRNPIFVPFATNFKLSIESCRQYERTLRKFVIDLIILVVSCMLWCTLDLICLMWLV